MGLTGVQHLWSPMANCEPTLWTQLRVRSELLSSIQDRMGIYGNEKNWYWIIILYFCITFIWVFHWRSMMTALKLSKIPSIKACHIYLYRYICMKLLDKRQLLICSFFTNTYHKSLVYLCNSTNKLYSQTLCTITTYSKIFLHEVFPCSNSLP